MTELKTLKDIEINNWDQMDTYEVWLRNKLRQEAIKWIKALKNPNVTEDEFYELNWGTFWNEYTDINDVIAWIKQFFNITDEELK